MSVIFPKVDTRLEKKTLKAAHTPDPDDAYAWWAISRRKLSFYGGAIDVETNSIQVINEKCMEGLYDIAAISSAAYPFLSKEYVILSVGASVGRGYGPVLASQSIIKVTGLAGKRVAIPGRHTTGALLLHLLIGDKIDFECVEMPCNRVAQAIVEGEVDAGVLIHEELLNWGPNGLKKLICLGGGWQKKTGLPIPVGLNVVKRNLGESEMKGIANLLFRSMKMAEENHELARNWALEFSHQSELDIAQKFIGMFANEDTMDLKDDCIQALENLYFSAYKRGLIPCLPQLDIVKPEIELLKFIK